MQILYAVAAGDLGQKCFRHRRVPAAAVRNYDFHGDRLTRRSPPPAVFSASTAGDDW